MAHELDLNQLDIQLSKGEIQLNNLELNVQVSVSLAVSSALLHSSFPPLISVCMHVYMTCTMYQILNDMIPDVPLTLIGARVRSVHLSIPWASLLSQSCTVRMDGKLLNFPIPTDKRKGGGGRQEQNKLGRGGDIYERDILH